MDLKLGREPARLDLPTSINCHGNGDRLDDHHDDGVNSSLHLTDDNSNNSMKGDRLTSTPTRSGPREADIPEELSIDTISEKDCPTEFIVDDSSMSLTDESQRINVPIIGFEIMDERAKFTVFKLHVQKSESENWFVFRRYTDFIWLNDQLKVHFPVFRLNLPPKRWFGDNFDNRFLDDRQLGLQAFVNNIIGHREVSQSQPVRDFLCLDDPPGPHESLEESRAMCECLEESMYKFRRQIFDKDTKIRELEDLISMYETRVDSLEKVLKLERSFNPNSPQNPQTNSSHVPPTDEKTKEKVKEKVDDTDSRGVSVAVGDGVLTDGELRNIKASSGQQETMAMTSPTAIDTRCNGDHSNHGDGHSNGSGNDGDTGRASSVENLGQTRDGES